MKKLITILTAALVITSCSDTKKPAPADTTTRVILGAYQKDGKKRIGEVLEITRDDIKRDSITKEKTIITYTIYAVWENFFDSTGKPIKRLIGKDSLPGSWMRISNDSVNTHVENIPIDSLLKIDK